ncbi:MAG: ribonuclease J [Deltaproteobacteria bacterium]|nr:ribonuclease J [Deltaproteobacteria bacterium]
MPENSTPLKMIPLGGLGEIGLNMMVLEYGDSIMVVDCGLMFPEDFMLGVDVVIPDFDYLRQNPHKKVAGIVLTHSHEDHIGALPYLLREIDAPVYGTPFTLGLVHKKLEEREPPVKAILIEIKPRHRVRIGPFLVEPVKVGHSVVDGVGLAIYTPVGLVVHTGDFKITHDSGKFGTTDVARFAQLGEEGVLALFSDSTNAEKEGYTISENTIGKTLDEIARTSPGRMIVAVFASNIPRICQVVASAKKKGAKICFNGRSIEASVQIARQLGYLDITDDMLIDVEQLEDYPDNEVVIITTGSQGEPMSALARIVSGTHRQIKVTKNDTFVLSSKFIPGNEKAIAQIINRLYRLGAEVIYEKISDIHVSGHAFREELKLMIQLVKPRNFIPVHGEYRHLTHHARLGVQMGIPESNILIVENGSVVSFEDGRASVTGNVETGRTLIDGKGIGDVGRSVLRERRALSEHGVVVVSLVLDAETGYVLYGPDITSRGFVFEMEKGHLLTDAVCEIVDLVENTDMSSSERIPAIKKEIQRVLRRHFSFVIQRKPVIVPIIIEI